MTTPQTSEVTFAADYLNASSDSQTFKCSSLSEVQAKYHYDKAADGAIMRSTIEYPGILVRGIDARAVEALGWKPTRLLFKDAMTGEPKEFAGEVHDSIEPNTVKFVLPG